MIQCVGSREEPNNYCSRICCQDAIKNAIAIKKKTPDAQVVILYRDIRTYGLREDYYTMARDLGVIFVRFDPEKKPDNNRRIIRIIISVLNTIYIIIAIYFFLYKVFYIGFINNKYLLYILQKIFLKTVSKICKIVKNTFLMRKKAHFCL